MGPCANLLYEKVISLQVHFDANQSHFHILSVTLTLKPRPNRPASSHKWRQVELACRLALGGQTEVSSQVHVGRRKKKSTVSSISSTNKRLMDINQLVLTWVGWQNREKRL